MEDNDEKLRKALPKILEKSLEGENKITKMMIMTLWKEVVTYRGSGSPKQSAQTAMDDTFDKLMKIIHAGK